MQSPPWRDKAARAHITKHLHSNLYKLLDAFFFSSEAIYKQGDIASFFPGYLFLFVLFVTLNSTRFFQGNTVSSSLVR